MNKYQSHKIVEAARITDFNAATLRDEQIDPAHDGAFTLKFEDGSEGFMDGETGERILKMAELAGTTINGGWLINYPDGYVSWSPHEVFADGYDLVQPSSGKSKIAGYRELNEGEVAAINDVKGVGAMLGDFIDIQRNDELVDQRWVSIGVTHLQQGLMCLTRAIAKPDFF